MTPRRSAISKYRRLGAAVIACSLLCGCSLKTMLLGVKTDYALQGAESDKETATYLQTIMEERTAQKTATLADEKKDPDLRARQEKYIEQTVRADLLKALHAKGYYEADVGFEDGATPLSGRTLASIITA